MNVAVYFEGGYVYPVVDSDLNLLSVWADCKFGNGSKVRVDIGPWLPSESLEYILDEYCKEARKYNQMDS